MKIVYVLILFFFCFCFLSKAEQKAITLFDAVSDSKNQKAMVVLKQTLESYHLKTMQIKVEQEIFLSAITTSMKSHGILNIKGEKFQLELKGNPSSLMLFDGEFLWYQADKSEKTVFQLKNYPQMQILTSFFSKKDFFDMFYIKKARQQNQEYVFQLLPKKSINGLVEIFMKAGTHISEVRLVWKELNNWQKYKFSKPVHREFPDKYFQFSSSGFQVITKT